MVNLYPNANLFENISLYFDQYLRGISLHYYIDSTKVTLLKDHQEEFDLETDFIKTD